MSEVTFNSLFEMLLLRQAELGNLLTATFNSLFEMPFISSS